MADRILIGNAGGNKVLRISKPGFDVKDKANPMIFSSDNDYLKIHHRNKVKLNKWSPFEGDGAWYGQYSFPALTYYPLVWYRFMWHWQDGSVQYPEQGDLTFWDGSCVVTYNNIWFVAENWADYLGEDIYVDYIIFKNRMM